MEGLAVAALVVGTVVVLAVPALALSSWLGELVDGLRDRIRSARGQARTP
jgi:predicted dinucleotide-binding enzyme